MSQEQPLAYLSNRRLSAINWGNFVNGHQTADEMRLQTFDYHLQFAKTAQLRADNSNLQKLRTYIYVSLQK